MQVYIRRECIYVMCHLKYFSVPPFNYAFFQGNDLRSLDVLVTPVEWCTEEAFAPFSFWTLLVSTLLESGVDLDVPNCSVCTPWMSVGHKLLSVSQKHWASQWWQSSGMTCTCAKSVFHVDLHLIFFSQFFPQQFSQQPLQLLFKKVCDLREFKK